MRVLLIIVYSMLVLSLASAQNTRIIDGTETSDYPSVGIVGNEEYGFCTGTLIGPNKVLTAAHCVLGDDPEELIFTVGGQDWPVSEAYVHPGYDVFNFGTDAADDLAVLILESNVDNVTPSPLMMDKPKKKQELILVGFGNSGTGSNEGGNENSDFGTKRVGFTPIEKVGKTLLHWTFDAGEGSTAHGDSGGAAFINMNDTLYLAGVTSGGNPDPTLFGGEAYDTRVDAYLDWIANPFSIYTAIYQIKYKYQNIDDEDSKKGNAIGYLIVDDLNDVIVATYYIDTYDPVIWSYYWQENSYFWGYFGKKNLYLASSSWYLNWETDVAYWNTFIGSPKKDVLAGYPIPSSLKGQAVDNNSGGSLFDSKYTAKLDKKLTAELAPNQAWDDILPILQQRLADKYDAPIAEFDRTAGPKPQGAVPPKATTTKEAVSIASSNSSNSTRIRVHKISGTEYKYGSGIELKNKVLGYFIYQGSTDSGVLLFVIKGKGYIDAYSADMYDEYDLFLNYVANDTQKDYHVVYAGNELDPDWIYLSGKTKEGTEARSFTGSWYYQDEAYWWPAFFKTKEDKKLTALAETQTLEQAIDHAISILEDKYDVEFDIDFE